MIRKHGRPFEYCKNPLTVSEATYLGDLVKVMGQRYKKAKIICSAMAFVLILCFFAIVMTDNFVERAASFLGLHEVCVRGLPLAILIIFVATFHFDRPLFRWMMRKDKVLIKIGDKDYFDSGNPDYKPLADFAKINTANLPVKGEARELYRNVASQGRDLMEFEICIMQDSSMLRNFIDGMGQAIESRTQI